jgi:hypothetical protein
MDLIGSDLLDISKMERYPNFLFQLGEKLIVSL